MKTLLTLAMVLTASVACADQQITFQWDPSPGPNLAGYRLYSSPDPGTYPFGPQGALTDVPAGTNQVTVTVPDGVWYFVVTAYSDFGTESGPSNEVNNATPIDPTNFRITVVVEVSGP